MLLISCRVVNTLKDYAIQALVNTIDHLGSVTFKVNGLLDEQVDEVSETELRVSCIEQVLLCFLVILFSIILLRWIFVLGISSSKRCLNPHILIWCSFFCAVFFCGASYKLPLSSLHSIESTNIISHQNCKTATENSMSSNYYFFILVRI